MDKLMQKPGESNLCYHRRLVYGKLVDGTLADEDYSELSQFVYGKEYSSDVARRMMYGSRRTLEMMDEASEESITGADIINDLEAKKIELQKERQKFYDQRTAFNKVVRESARREELDEILAEAIQSGSLPSLNYAPADIPASENDLLVSLNDLHYGAVVNNYWCKYDSNVCRDMLSRYIDKIKQVAKTHGSERCIVWENGDVISGNIHNEITVTNKENVIQQVMGASELIADFLAELSHLFREVHFVSVSGNHSRIDLKDRALRDERLDDLVEWYLKARMSEFKNVFIGSCRKIDGSMYLLDVRGQTYCGVHGDYDCSEAKVRSLQVMAQEPLYAILTAHKHHNNIDSVAGVKTIMAGSFLGMDDFCVEKRIYGKPQQLILVCDCSGVRCTYDVNF